MLVLKNTLASLTSKDSYAIAVQNTQNQVTQKIRKIYRIAPYVSCVQVSSTFLFMIKPDHWIPNLNCHVNLTFYFCFKKNLSKIYFTITLRAGVFERGVRSEKGSSRAGTETFLKIRDKRGQEWGNFNCGKNWYNRDMPAVAQISTGPTRIVTGQRESGGGSGRDQWLHLLRTVPVGLNQQSSYSKIIQGHYFTKSLTLYIVLAQIFFIVNL